MCIALHSVHNTNIADLFGIVPQTKIILITALQDLRSYIGCIATMLYETVTCVGNWQCIHSRSTIGYERTLQCTRPVKL